LGNKEKDLAKDGCGRMQSAPTNENENPKIHSPGKGVLHCGI